MAFAKKRLIGLDSFAETLKTNIQNALLPRGAIVWFSGRTTAPSGWAICDGTNGTPDLIGRYPLGATSDIGGKVEAGLPGISSSTSFFDGAMWKHSGTCGGLFSDGGRGFGGAGHDGNTPGHRIYLNLGNTGVYGKSDTVTPPSVKLLPCMKL